MQQRQLRLGDILDDYCPRERRITNHAIVAMVGNVVKQTRCTTCEAEHEYKHAKAPTLRRRKDAPAALFNEVLAGMPEEKAEPSADPSTPSIPQQDVSTTDRSDEVPPNGQDEAPAPESNGGEPEPGVTPEEEGPVHRRLIRATLPRPEGQAPGRPLPDFTMRRPGHRHAGGFPSFRDRGGPQGRSPNGARGGGFGRGAGPKSDFGRPGRGESRPGRRGHGRRGGKKH